MSFVIMTFPSRSAKRRIIAVAIAVFAVLAGASVAYAATVSTPTGGGAAQTTTVAVTSIPTLAVTGTDPLLSAKPVPVLPQGCRMPVKLATADAHIRHSFAHFKLSRVRRERLQKQLRCVVPSTDAARVRAYLRRYSRHESRLHARAIARAKARVADATPPLHPVLASYYALYGNRTACGETLTPTTLGVANRTLPCGTIVVLKYGNTVLRVPVIDRGPYVYSRYYDMTMGTAHALGVDMSAGVNTVYTDR